MSNGPLNTWAMERELVLCRVINAPRERVFAAWTDPKQITQWFGPAGFKTETLACDIRPGGIWRFVYTAPNGTVYDNRIQFVRLEHPHLIEMLHGSDKDNDPGQFHVTVTFESQSDGKTVLTMRQLHPTVEQRNAGLGFGAVEYGYQTIDKLAKHVGAE